MPRTMRAKRLYSLGNYQNLELVDEITDIPDELAFDEEYIKNLTIYQLFRLEARAQVYNDILDLTKTLPRKEVKQVLEKTIEEVLERLNNKKEE